MKNDPGLNSPGSMLTLWSAENPQRPVRATKTTIFRQDGSIEKHDDRPQFPKRWHWGEEDVSTLEDMHAILMALQREHDAVITRAGLFEDRADPDRPITRQLLGKGGLMIDVERSWVVIDIDSSDIALPLNWCDDPLDHIDGIVQEHLPEAFHEAGYVVQFSASMAPAGGSPKFHLFFILDRPLYTAAVRKWLKTWDVDPTTFDDNRIIFTSAPICVNENKDLLNHDPLGTDRVLLAEGGLVPVPDKIESVAEPVIDIEPDEVPKINPHLGSQSWRSRLDWIGDHEGQEGVRRPGKGLHPAILSVIVRAVEENYVPGMPIDELRPFMEGEVFPAIIDAAFNAELDPTRIEERKATREAETDIEELRRGFEGWAWPTAIAGMVREEKRLAELRAKFPGKPQLAEIDDGITRIDADSVGEVTSWWFSK